MRLTASAWALHLLVIAIPNVAHADSAPSSVFTQAIMDGEARAPLANDGQFAKAIAAIKRRTGDNGPVVIYATRVTMFHQQPHCGRVSFIIGQPGSHIVYRDMAGEFNICDDGDPPLRICTGHPENLVPADSICADMSKPVDTPEVAAAIAAAIAAGGMTPEQAATTVRAAQPPASVGAQP
jgi:hypothetical protein